MAAHPLPFCCKKYRNESCGIFFAAGTLALPARDNFLQETNLIVLSRQKHKGAGQIPIRTSVFIRQIFRQVRGTVYMNLRRVPYQIHKETLG